MGSVTSGPLRQRQSRLHKRSCPRRYRFGDLLPSFALMPQAQTQRSSRVSTRNSADDTNTTVHLYSTSHCIRRRQQLNAPSSSFFYQHWRLRRPIKNGTVVNTNITWTEALLTTLSLTESLPRRQFLDQYPYLIAQGIGILRHPL